MSPHSSSWRMQSLYGLTPASARRILRGSYRPSWGGRMGAVACQMGSCLDAFSDAVAVQERDLNSDDDFGDSKEVVYYHSNTLFSVYALSDANENVIERYRYDAAACPERSRRGACTVLDADACPPGLGRGSADADGLSDVDNPYAFTGRRLDVESGLMQYRNRYYHPALGRFISWDRFEYAGAKCLYDYARANPTHAGDSFGLVPTLADEGYSISDDAVVYWSVWKSDRGWRHGGARLVQSGRLAVNAKATYGTWVDSGKPEPDGPFRLKKPGTWNPEYKTSYIGMHQTNAWRVPLVCKWKCSRLNYYEQATLQKQTTDITIKVFSCLFYAAGGNSGWQLQRTVTEPTERKVAGPPIPDWREESRTKITYGMILNLSGGPWGGYPDLRDLCKRKLQPHCDGPREQPKRPPYPVVYDPSVGIW